MNINTATEKEIEKGLPGVGSKTAAKIVKARPIRDVEDLMRVVPPSAMLQIEKAGVGIEFDLPKPVEETSQPPDEVEPVVEPQAPPVTIDEMRLRRVLPGERLKEDSGVTYLCVWNMRWAPDLSPHLPMDDAVQAEITQKFQGYGVKVAFAHHAPSITMSTVSRGVMPLVLFEVLEKEGEENGNESGG